MKYMLLIVSAFSVLFSQVSLAHAVPAPVPQTGQTACYSVSDAILTVIPCAGTGQDGDIKAGVAWPDPRFTDLKNGTVTDNLTGLMWTKDANSPGPVACNPAATKTWQGALDYAGCLNTNSYLGYSDWRVPTVLELRGLVDMSHHNPVLPAGHPFTSVGDYMYWSGTSSAFGPTMGTTAWYFNMMNGWQSSMSKTLDSNTVWPVRSGQLSPPAPTPKTGQTTSYSSRDDGALQPGVAWPIPRFIDEGNGSVTDKLTGLTWLKNAGCSSTSSWASALYQANTLANGVCGLTDGSEAGDWHLPNDKELLSLVDYGHSNPALPVGHPFTGLPAAAPSIGYAYWSSSSGSSSSSIKKINLAFGNAENVLLDTNNVWPVRSGQSWSFGSLTLSVTATDHGTVQIGALGASNQIRLRNSGTTPVAINAINLTGVSPSQFTFVPGGSAPCENFTPTLETGAACTLLVTANPTTTGVKTANLTIVTATGSKDIPLTATAYSTILGTVTDMSTGQPVSGALITLNTGEMTSSNSKGFYTLGTSIAPGTYNITVSKNGFQSATAANLVVTATASETADIMLPTTGPLNISSALLPSATAGTAYHSRVMIAGGTPPFAFSLYNGNLPAGLALDPLNGTISGTPSGSGNATFTIKVADGVADSSSQQYTIDLTGTLAITNTTLPRATTGSSYPATLTATGGKASYSYTVTGGSLPGGLTLATGGAFGGKPTATGDFPVTIAVTDSTGRTANKNLTISVDTPLVITTNNMDIAKQGIPYNMAPAITGGYSTKTWSLYAGIMPAGLSLDSGTGIVSGTPSEVTSRVITLLVTDEVGRTAFKSYPLTVTVPVGFSSTKLPNAPWNVPYSEKVQVIGGMPPYSFSMTGILPTGLSLDHATGTVSGTASSVSSKNISVTVTDSSYPVAQTATKTFSIQVSDAITPTTAAILPSAKKNVAITPVTFGATGGSAPYTWSHIGGTLPDGITFNPFSATLSGTPANAGDFSFTLHLADGVGNQTGDTVNPDKVFTLHVSDTLEVTLAGLPTAALNVPYSATLTSNGGLKPITWRVSAGTLPVGLTLDATTGQLSGTPTGSSATVTFEASDSDTTKQTATKQQTITVSSTLTIIETVLPDSRTSNPYSANIRAQFGTAPYSWKISSGTLPAGLSLSSTNTNATINGTPTSAGTASFTVEVADSSATPQKVTRQFDLTTQGVLVIPTSSLPALTSGQPYAAAVAVVGGAKPYTFAVTSGALPQGIFLNSASGVVSGTASTTGGSSFTVTITDSGIPSQSVSQAYTLAALVSVTVTKSEAAAGTISSIPEGISCDTSCVGTSGSFAAGSSVALTAVPVAGYYLVSWNGCDSTNGNTCNVSARAGLGAIIASFSKMSFTKTSLDVSSAMILQAGAVTISGKVTPLPDSGGDLTGLPIDITITAPDASSTTQHTTTDASGHYLISNLTGFTRKGAYVIKANFAGSANLSQSSSFTQTVLVGSQAGYAILVQGKILNGEGLASHNKTANKIYKSLKYLSYQTSSESIDAGVAVDDAPSRSAIQNAITTWAAEKLQDIAAPLYIILVDHGSNGNFIINSETITPGDLNNWLTTLEGGLTIAAKEEKRIVIIGSCYSGSFIPILSKAGRVIITSATASEESYKGPLEPDGIRSGEYFLDSFFAELKNGRSLETSFGTATQVIRSYTRQGASSNGIGLAADGAVQHPLLDDDGSKSGTNMTSNVDGDGMVARDIYLGVGDTLTNAAQASDITGVTPTSFLDSSNNTLQLWLTTVGSHSAVSSAWVEVRSPSITLNPTGTSTVQLDLTLDKQLMQPKNGTTNQWELPAPYNGFSSAGRYEIYYYARDATTGNISSLMRSIVYKNRNGNNPPTQVTLVWPANSSNQKTMNIFRWNLSTDQDDDKISYTLEIALDNDFSNIAFTQENIEVSATYLADGTLKDLTTYYWRIKAIDQFGAISVSTPFSFSTDNTNGLLDSIVTGTILNSVTGTPLSLATLRVGTGTDESLLSGGTGVFLFGTPTTEGSTSATITVQAAGFKSRTIPITVAAGNVVSATVYLEPEPISVKSGDCDGDGSVSIAEVQSAINMFLGLKTIATCVDIENSGGVSISEVQKTINAFLGI